MSRLALGGAGGTVDTAGPAVVAGSRSWKRRVWIGYLVVAGALTLLYLFAPSLAGNALLINMLGLSSPIAIAVGITMHRPKALAAWWLFAVGQFLFFAGDLYTYSYPKILHADVPFPSAGDAIYLMVYPALMAGLILLVRRRNTRRERSGLIDSLILSIGIGLLSWVFLVAPTSTSRVLPTSRKPCRPPIRSATSCCSRQRSGWPSTRASEHPPSIS